MTNSALRTPVTAAVCQGFVGQPGKSSPSRAEQGKRPGAGRHDGLLRIADIRLAIVLERNLDPVSNGSDPTADPEGQAADRLSATRPQAGSSPEKLSAWLLEKDQDPSA